MTAEVADKHKKSKKELVFTKGVRKKTPTVIQMEAVECGAAALAIILGYYRRFEPLEKLRVACGVSRDGSKASNVLRAARNYGLKASGKQVSNPANLTRYNVPFIAFWNFNHFLVVEGFGTDRVYLNDPAVGPRVVTSREFDASFTGVALFFEPGPEFEKGGRPAGVIRPLLGQLKDFKSPLSVILLIGLALVLPGLVIPTFSKIFVDDILGAKRDDWINPLMWAFGAAIFFQALMSIMQQRIILMLQMKLSLVTSGRFLLHVLKMPMVFFTQRHGGEVGSRVQLNDQVANLLGGDLATNMVNLFTIIFYAAIMFTYDVVLTAISICFAMLNLWLLQYVSRKRTDLNRRLQSDKGKLTSTSMGGVQTIEALKASGQETDFFNRWAGFYNKVYNSRQEIELPTQLLSVIPRCFDQLAVMAILIIGALRVMDGHMTIGGLVAFQALLAAFSQPVNNLIQLGTRLQEIQSDMNRVNDVLHYDTDEIYEENESEKSPKVRLDGYLKLRDVTFGYSPLDPPLIENFHLDIVPGRRVALVGPSGSGKSTVIRLITGLYKPWSGQVLFDDYPADHYSRKCLCNSMALVDQDIFLFESTVKENIALWDPTIKGDEVVAAGKDACIHDDVVIRDLGYESGVKEAGTNFSGGQRQRLEIARALVRNPRILILDEATSALDPVTEMEIDLALRRRGCACLIIAHRLSTIRDCDEIVVMDSGKIVQRGTHGELIRDAEGLYANLVEN